MQPDNPALCAFYMEGLLSAVPTAGALTVCTILHGVLAFVWRYTFAGVPNLLRPVMLDALHSARARWERKCTRRYTMLRESAPVITMCDAVGWALRGDEHFLAWAAQRPEHLIMQTYGWRLPLDSVELEPCKYANSCECAILLYPSKIAFLCVVLCNLDHITVHWRWMSSWCVPLFIDQNSELQDIAITYSAHKFACRDVLEQALWLTQMRGMFAEPRRELPATTAVLLLALVPRGIALARSAFGVLAAPAATDAVLERLHEASTHADVHSALRADCAFLRCVGTVPGVCGPRSASDQLLPEERDRVGLSARVDMVQFGCDDAQSALVELHARGVRAVPIVPCTLLSKSVYVFEERMRPGASGRQQRGRRICTALRQRGGIYEELAASLLQIHADFGVGIVGCTGARVPDVSLVS